MFFTRILELAEALTKQQQKLSESFTRMASALDNLTAAVTRLQASVDSAVTVLNTPHPTDAQVQMAADAVNAQSDRLDAATTTPPVAPPPSTPPPTP
jgi:hypothetical protein